MYEWSKIGLEYLTKDSDEYAELKVSLQNSVAYSAIRMSQKGELKRGKRLIFYVKPRE